MKSRSKLFSIAAIIIATIAPIKAWASTQNTSTLPQIQIDPLPKEAIEDPLKEAQSSFKICLKNPLNCAQNPSDLLSSLDGVPQQITNQINSYFNQQLSNLQNAALGSLSGILKNSGIGNIASSLGLGGIFGGGSTPITSSDIQASGNQSLAKVAAQSIANEAATNYLNTLKASQGGSYRIGTATIATTQGSEAIAQSIVGTSGLNQNNAVAAISSNNVKESTSVANSDKDSSLDAIQGTNQILSKIASQNDLIVGTLNDQKVIAAQNLKQAAVTQKTLDNQQLREDMEVERYTYQVERTTDYIQGMFGGKK
jgi:hypothetical protein